MAETFRLRFYDDDGVTIAAEFSTDPGHARSYLVVPDQLAMQKIDLANGRATIGSCRIEIVDVATVPADQDTGYVTSILADVDGLTARIGRRAHLEVLIGASYENVINGVIEDAELHDSYSSFLFTIKDQRENERRTRAFSNTQTPSVLPRGVIAGFGFNAESGTWLVPPTEPIVATYQENGTRGMLDFPKRADRVPIWQVVTPAMMPVLNGWVVKRDITDANIPTQRYALIKLYWRVAGSGGVYNEVEPGYAELQLTFASIATATFKGGSFPPGTFQDPRGDVHSVRYIDAWFFLWPTGATRPSAGQSVEVILGYNGPPTKEYPYHLDGMTHGELLAGLYDADYSDPGALPLVQYDPVTVALLTEPVLGRITAPLDSDDGIWKWTEDNIYKPLGAAPALDSDGLISPVRDRLPDIADVLLELNDANCEAIPGWSHTGSDALNDVGVEYPRLFRVPAEIDPNGEYSAGDGIAEIVDPVRKWHIGSKALLGDRPLTIKAPLLGAIGGVDGEPITGDVADELGHQLALRRINDALDRYAYGGQHFGVRVLRSSLGSRRVGDWCIVATSWTPEYSTGQRGGNRVAQIVDLKLLDSQWADLELVDGGPDLVPVGQPTLGALTVTAEGEVDIPVTVVAAGSEARADYAVNDIQPAADSPLWRFAGRVAVASTIRTPAVPAGATVWVRARGEQTGRRPSAWTNAITIVAPLTPRVRMVRVTMDHATGAVTVTWEPNAAALGVRLHYDVHATGTDPGAMTTVDVIASALSYTLPAGTVAYGEDITVDVEPWTGWTGSAVSGTAGTKVRATATRHDLEGVALGLVDFRDTIRTVETVTYEWVRGAAVDSVWVYDSLQPNPPPADPWPGPSDLPTAILSAGTDIYVANVPPPGYLRRLQFEPRGAVPDLAVGPVERVTIDPTLDPPDVIHSLQVTVDDDDGSAVIRVDAGDRTDSYRYAYVVGPGEPAWPTDAAVEGGTVETISGSDAIALPAGTVGWNERIRVRAAPYINVDGTGTDGAGDHGEIKSAEDIRLKPPVELDITTETESGAVGTFGVTVRDGSGIATDLSYRTKSGHNAFGAWTLKTATPTDGVEYVETVALVEDHLSQVMFRLDYVFNGDLLSLHSKSVEFDRGQIPNGVIKPILNENDDTASADLLGDFDTVSWKVVAAVGAMPSDATVRAATAVDGRMIRASVLGVLLTGLTMGQVVFYKAFGYSGAGGTGNESSAPITAEAIYKVAAPVLEGTTAVESGNVGQFGVTVRDPAGQGEDLYYRTKSGSGVYGAWTLKTASPTDNTEYLEDVFTIENHPSHVQFRLDFTIASDPQSVTLESPAFDRGAIPDGVIIPTVTSGGDANAVGKGDFDSGSWKMLASTSGFPTDAAVRGETAVNGRVAQFSGLLTGVPLGSPVYYKAFIYSGAAGAGNESSVAITAIVNRESAMAPKVQEEVVRSGTTATCTIRIRDEQLRITAVEFNEREGDNAETGWVTSWDSTTGTIATDRDLVRSEFVTVANGKDSELRWRVVYTDELGVSRTIGGALPLTNMQVISKTIMIPHTQFISQQPETQILHYNTIWGFPVMASGSVLAQASMVLPKGVTVTLATMRLYKSGGTCTVQAIFGRVNRASSTYTNLMAVTHGGSGWENLADATLNETVGDDVYTAIAQFTNVNSEDVRVAWFEITYTVPSYANSY